MPDNLVKVGLGQARQRNEEALADKNQFKGARVPGVQLFKLTGPRGHRKDEEGGEKVAVAHDVEDGGQDVPLEHQIANLLAHAWPTELLASVHNGYDEHEKEETEYHDAHIERKLVPGFAVVAEAETTRVYS